MNRWWLVLHVLGSILFLGNIIVTFFWKVMADRTRDASVVAFAQKIVGRTDHVFTALGAGLLAMSGYAHAKTLQMSVTQTSWLLWAQIFFYASAVIWAVFLVPIQRKQGKIAEDFAKTGVIPDEYWRLARRWNVMGTVATVLPLLSMALMVLKRF